MLPLLIVALSLTVAADAPAAIPVEPASPIVVEGQRDRHERLRQFVRALTPAPMHGQLPRFSTLFCPRVIGLSQAQDRWVAGRMREVARAARIPLAKPGCDANALLI